MNPIGTSQAFSPGCSKTLAASPPLETSVQHGTRVAGLTSPTPTTANAGLLRH
jgi:hypothetical protein